MNETYGGHLYAAYLTLLSVWKNLNYDFDTA